MSGVKSKLAVKATGPFVVPTGSRFRTGAGREYKTTKARSYWWGVGLVNWFLRRPKYSLNVKVEEEVSQ